MGHPCLTGCFWTMRDWLTDILIRGELSICSCETAECDPRPSRRARGLHPLPLWASSDSYRSANVRWWTTEHARTTFDRGVTRTAPPPMRHSSTLGQSRVIRHVHRGVGTAAQETQSNVNCGTATCRPHTLNLRDYLRSPSGLARPLVAMP